MTSSKEKLESNSGDEKLTAGLTCVIGSILANANIEAMAFAESLADRPEISQAQAAADAGDLKAFEASWCRHQRKLLEGIIQRSPALRNRPEAQALFRDSEKLHWHLRELFSELEGSSCCADKARTVVRALTAYYLHDKPIAFNYEQEYTYHLPKKLLATQEEILRYFLAFRHLLAGRFKPYREFIDEVEQRFSAP